MKNFMRRIPLRNKDGGINTYSLIDNKDFDLVVKYKWHLGYGRHTRYAVSSGFKNKHSESLHRFLMGFPRGKEVDHINGNGLDNRRNNLRIVTKQQNRFNLIYAKVGISGERGVCWDEKNKSWRVRVQKNYKIIDGGRFKKRKNAVAEARRLRDKVYDF